ncbi:MAG: class I tRNA ligase family protein, partial [Acutalibacteraceae bacterium]
TKNYLNWMNNIRDWCISRQLWWGHQIPAYYCDDCGEVIVAKEAPEKCPKCGGAHLHQDPDTLDTWFSSALWPFSTLGWPDEDSEDLKWFYPTNTLVTGYDIIGFWVSRMIFSGIAYTGKAPFDTVCIHGIVRDAQGRKMSKSLGNGIDPLEEIDKFGADALRFTLSTGNAPGNDMRYLPEKAEASRNFANKLWNAARFILMNLSDDEKAPHLPEKLSIEDKWVLKKYNDLVKEVTDNLEKFELGVAVSKLYDFIWDILCDWYIELSKVSLNSEDEAEKSRAKAVLVYVMSNTLKLLHPFMPFITEEIWQTLPHEGESIMISSFPVYDEKLDFSEDEKNFEKVMAAVKAIRNRRSEMNVAPSKKAAVYIETSDEATFDSCKAFFVRLAGASEVEIGKNFELEGAVNIVTSDAKIFIPMNELVDFEAERKRLEKELADAERNLGGIEARLSNPAFVSKAPEAVVNADRARAAQLRDKIAMIREGIEKLG